MFHFFRALFTVYIMLSIANMVRVAGLKESNYRRPTPAPKNKPLFYGPFSNYKSAALRSFSLGWQLSYSSVCHGVGVGVGVTTVKFTVMERPLVPVPPTELHGVATSVWVPIAVGVQLKSKGIAESVFTLRPSLLNTTLSVYGFVWAVTV